MKKLLFFFSIILTLGLNAQIQLSETQFDLGEISLLNEDIVDLQLKNLSNENVFILRIETDRATKVQYTSKTISANSNQTLRLKINPVKKGKVEKEVKLYLSSNSEPIALKVRADVKELPKNNKQACPDFSSIPTQNTTAQNIVGISKTIPVALFNSETKDELLAAYNSPTETEEETREVRNVKPTARTVRPERTKRIKKTPEERRNSPSLGTILFGKTDTSTTIEEPENLDEIAIDQQNQRVEYEDDIEIKESLNEDSVNTKVEVVTSSNLFDNSYKPNNIVFLIDASNSMREEEKMDILKEAMVELVEPLREIDFLSIVTYSGEATVILNPTPGNKKQEIIQLIQNIEADGSTQAVKGIKKAIEVGNSNFIESGNNQIFLASDGAFDIGERNKSLRRKIKTTAEEGLTIDVLGIKNEKWTNKSLKEIAELGQGNLIKIKSFNDANKVLSEVKKKSSN